MKPYPNSVPNLSCKQRENTQTNSSSLNTGNNYCVGGGENLVSQDHSPPAYSTESHSMIDTRLNEEHLRDLLYLLDLVCLKPHINVSHNAKILAQQLKTDLLASNVAIRNLNGSSLTGDSTTVTLNPFSEEYIRRLYGDINTLPSLPVINSKDLLERVFTHRSASPIHLGKEDNQTYEPLEFVGDAYLELIATRFIHANFPKWPVVRKSQLRESLVKNETLTEYAKEYNFIGKIRIGGMHCGLDNGKQPGRKKGENVPLKSDTGGLSSKGWMKVFADVFEAYIAAIIFDDPFNGFGITELWLSQLFWRTIRARNLDSNSTLPSRINESELMGCKAKLHSRLLYPGCEVKIQYRDEGPPVYLPNGSAQFTIGVYLTGWGHDNLRLAVGTATSKQKAGSIAAFNALTEKTELIEQCYIRRLEYEQLVKAKK